MSDGLESDVHQAQGVLTRPDDQPVARRKDARCRQHSPADGLVRTSRTGCCSRSSWR